MLGELFRGTAVERERWESFVPGLALGAVQSSPCSAKTRGNGPFGACGESFVPVGLLVWVCWESFVPVGLLAGALGEFCTG